MNALFSEFRFKISLVILVKIPSLNYFVSGSRIPIKEDLEKDFALIIATIESGYY